MKKRIIALMLVLVLALSSFTACSKKRDTSPDLIVMEISDTQMTREEFLFYIAYYEYQGIYAASELGMDADEFWDSIVDDEDSDGETTYRQYFYTAAFADASYNMIFSKLATSNGYSLTDSEETLAKESAESDFAAFNEDEISRSGMTLNGFIKAYERRILVLKYTEDIKNGYEITADSVKSDLNRSDYNCKETININVSIEGMSDEEKAAVKASLEDAAERLKNGAPVSSVKELVSNASSETRYVLETTSTIYSTTANALADGEVSDVIEYNDKYYVIQMVDTNSDYYYESAIEEAIDDKKDDMLELYYEQIVQTYTRTVNDKVLEEKEFGNFCND